LFANALKAEDPAAGAAGWLVCPNADTGAVFPLPKTVAVPVFAGAPPPPPKTDVAGAV